MQTPGMRHLAQILGAIALLSLLAGCGAERPAEVGRLAAKLMAEKDYDGAVIQLKGGLQSQPESGELRFLLGDAMLRSGNAGGAALE